MKNKLISVIVPVYNVEKYIKECLESIINQTYRNIEIILVDDGSTDNSGKICDEYAKIDSRIKVIHKENEGISKTRNIGIEKACGEYIQFADSDDYMEIDAIEKIYNIAKEYNADIVSFSHYILNNGKLIGDYNNTIKELNTSEAIKELLLDNKIRNYLWEKMWKRELFKEIRFPEGKKFEDIATTAFLFEKANKVVFYDYPEYYYRQREGSILHKTSEELCIEYINTTLMVVNHIKKLKYEKINQYCNYSIVAATVRLFNDIALYDFKKLPNDETVNNLYDKVKEIMNNKEYEKMIVENMSTVFKLHLYYLLQNKDKYIQNNKYLPKLCAEHEQ